jgi:2-amino-4-hydroxy-6-hydroxymethyldihydropteridine diphosphokinase
LLGLGSNLGLCRNNLQNAIACILKHKGLRLIRQSGIYETQPQDITDQPWFCNQVILLHVMEFWTPWSLQVLLTDIEKQMGRSKKEQKGPRIIDLDILVFGRMVIQENGLQIPHVSMKKRAFVLVPMMEIYPEFVFPDGERLNATIDKLVFKLEGNRIYQQS